MFSKHDLKNFLQQNSTEAKIVKFEFVSAEKFSVDLKCKVDKDETADYYSQYAGDWIKKFGKFTTTTWIVRNCFPKLKRLLYRKVFACHRSAFNKKKKPNFETRNQDCRAKVDFRMKFINRNTIKNDPLLKEGLNLTISIDFIHTHKVRAPESYNLLKSSSETDDVLQEYFDTGCTPGAAKYYHELTIIDKYGENCSDILSNANVNPSLRHFLYLHGKRRKENSSHPNLLYVMNMKKAELGIGGTTVSFTYDINEIPDVVAVVTPVMKRVIAEFGLDYVLIDSTVVPNGPVTTLFYVPTKIGALPVACVTYPEDSENYFYHAFFSVKFIFGIETDKEFEPKIIMLSHADMQKRHLARFCPKTRLMSSRYMLCSGFWRWLSDDENKVERKKRHSVMSSVKKLLYAETLKTAEKAYKELIDQSSSKLKDYIDSLWDRREEWMLLEEHNLSSSLVEASVRFNKEFLIRRCKAFNNILMVNVITKILENHQRRILLSHAKRCKVIETYTKFLTKAKIVLGFGSDVRRISENEFRIEYQMKPKKYLYFRTDTMCCDCLHSKRGHFCEHLSAIINTVDTEMMQVPSLTEHEQTLYTNLAGGEIEEEINSIRPETADEVKDLELHDDKDEMPDQIDETQSVPSTPKSVDASDYFYLEVKTERYDPLDESENFEIPNHDIQFPITDKTSLVQNEVTTSNSLDLKRKFEVALKGINDEFRRLNKFFRENPNVSNLGTMARLAKELSKIRPIERVNLENMQVKVNDTSKFQRND